MTDNDNVDPTGENDPRLILLDPNDNILGVARAVRAGEMLMINGEMTALDQHAGMGFKVAAP